MTSIQYYDSPLGRIRMEADEVGLTGLWSEGSKYDRIPNEYLEQETEILLEGKGSDGWINTSVGRNRISYRHYIRRDPRSR